MKSKRIQITKEMALAKAMTCVGEVTIRNYHPVKGSDHYKISDHIRRGQAEQMYTYTYRIGEFVKCPRFEAYDEAKRSRDAQMVRKATFHYTKDEEFANISRMAFLQIKHPITWDEYATQRMTIADERGVA